MSNDPVSLANALGVSKPSQLASAVTVVRGARRPSDPISKAEPKLLRSNALTVDDNQTTAFDSLGKGKVVKPTFDPVLLCLLMQQNNTLLQCSAAMEVNIDGTGYTIERADGEAEGDEDDKMVENLKQFFDEVYPGESFVSQRRALRRDMEATGNGYFEVIRNAGGDIVFLRRLDAKLMRLVMLDDAVVVEKKIKRMGKEQTVQMVVRERRYCMQVGTKFRFFREFGASRDVDMVTGEWLNKDGSAVPGSAPLDAGYNTGPKPLAGEPAPSYTPPKLPQGAGGEPIVGNGEKKAKPMLGTEVIHFKVCEDVATGYGVPRWINQTPAVLGSRKAEEFNLEFFNSGGLPPALVLVQGGQLAPGSKEALTNYLAGKAKYKQRGVIAEVFAAGGSLDGNGSVRVTVERFGDERQKDSMFQTYDKNCADHVRGAFRLPPLFLGLSADHNFATAYASYMVAEAQVFRPEREEFDEIINVKIMRELAPDYIFRSLPLQIQDVEMQLKALTLVKDMAEPEEFLKTINEIASVTLTAREDLGDQDALNVVNQLLGREALGGKLDARDGIGEEKLGPDGKPLPGAKGKPPKKGKGKPGEEAPARVEGGKDGKIKKMDDDILRGLADDWANHLSGRHEFEPASVAVMSQLIKSLGPQVRLLFNSYVALKVADPRHDVDGVSHLIAHAGECLTHTDAA
ncbi:MAG TPA: hypothetical protein VGD46_04905 [Rhizobacter sp.]